LLDEVETVGKLREKGYQRQYGGDFSNYIQWESKTNAEPKTAANGDWRLANSERQMASSEWRMVFLKGNAPALPKKFGAL
jgi:hypothetical protein